MSALSGPFAVVALVLAVGGVFKLRDPVPAAGLLGGLGLPARWTRPAARVSGAIELVVGLAAVLVGGRVAAAVVAALYLLFTVLTARAVQLGDRVASCGCFGRLSAPPTAVHVVTDAVAAVAALAAALVGAPGLVEARGAQPAAGVPFVGLVLLGTWLTVAVLTVLPEALVAARRTATPAAVRTFEITDARGGSW